MFMMIVILVVVCLAEGLLPSIVAGYHGDERSRVKLVTGGFELIIGGLLCVAVENGLILQFTESDEATMILQFVGMLDVLMGVYYLFVGIYEKLGELKMSESIEPKNEDRKGTSSGNYVDGWECSACHAINPRYTSSCLKCAKPRNSDSKVTSAGIGESVKIDRSAPSVSCPKCGTTQRPDKKYCFHCGVRFE